MGERQVTSEVGNGQLLCRGPNLFNLSNLPISLISDLFGDWGDYGDCVAYPLGRFEIALGQPNVDKRCNLVERLRQAASQTVSLGSELPHKANVFGFP
jgi:hypothetical protein